ncbi:phage holin family protein [Runella zeae]|uniref:phage holin family protein n=1 Tax=Runella zeae TaxID=94255 RepID=UPI0023572AB1|nr:phage holin family protein [Runella zeae]
MKKMIDFADFLWHKPVLMITTILLSIVKTVLDFVEIYLFNDWPFLWSLLVLVHVDTVLGFWKSAKNRTVSSRGFAGYFEKLGSYAAFLILTHVLITFPIEGTPTKIFAWINNVFYSAIMVREAISIVENIGAIKEGIIPTWILAYLKKYDASGKLEDLKNPNGNE